jgi:cytochrome c peroxidase
MQLWRRIRAGVLLGALLGLWSALGSSDSAPSPAAPAPPPSAAEPHAELIELGRAIFFDPNLSEPRGTSCASCHDPERAFSGSHGSHSGVPQGSRPTHFARRGSPSLLYLKYVPKFQYLVDDDDAIAPAPHGGFFWDGRSNSIRDLVRQPLLNPDEMNNKDALSIATKIQQASYAAEFQRQFGAVVSNPEATLGSVGQALEAFLSADDMSPFTSRYDAFVRGRGKLTPYEMQGMRLFKDPAKGGCVGCHRFYDTGRDPALSMFTDYGYDAVAVPRNEHLPAMRKADLGLCERTDKQQPSSDPEYCARFRTPSLRNVAVRGAYMHNGVFTNLRDVVAFYATRATDPKRWYKSGVKFEDVPAKYRSRVNVSSIPYNRREGDVPALNDQEIDAIVSFLQTLTDARYEKLAAH